MNPCKIHFTFSIFFSLRQATNNIRTKAFHPKGYFSRCLLWIIFDNINEDIVAFRPPPWFIFQWKITVLEFQDSEHNFFKMPNLYALSEFHDHRRRKMTNEIPIVLSRTMYSTFTVCTMMTKTIHIYILFSNKALLPWYLVESVFSV